MHELPAVGAFDPQVLGRFPLQERPDLRGDDVQHPVHGRLQRPVEHGGFLRSAGDQAAARAGRAPRTPSAKPRTKEAAASTVPAVARPSGSSVAAMADTIAVPTTTPSA